MYIIILVTVLMQFLTSCVNSNQDQLHLIITENKNNHDLDVVYWNNTTDTVAFGYVGLAFARGNGNELYDTRIEITQNNAVIPRDSIHFHRVYLPLRFQQLIVIPPNDRCTLGVSYLGNLYEDFKLDRNKPFKVKVVIRLSKRENLWPVPQQKMLQHPTYKLLEDSLVTPYSVYP